MASTKDLYDELKGNPLVNVKDDYETFNAKLKDANFLKRLDEVMVSIGKDINAYDIPKKKKDGEEESSQPTEQPSTNTGKTQAVGASQPEADGGPGANRELGPDEALVKQGFEDRGTYWFNKKTGQILQKPKKAATEKSDMPVADLQEPAKAPEMPEAPELVAPDQPAEQVVAETQAPPTPNTDVNNLDKTTVVGSVISEQEPDANKVNKIVEDANAVAGTTFKRKRKTDAEKTIIAYTPSSASDQVFLYEDGKIRSVDKRSDDYSKVIAENAYTVQLQNSEAFKDLIQLHKDGNKQGFENYLLTSGNPAAREIADRSFGIYEQENIIESTIISAENKDREIPVADTILGKLKSSNLYKATEGLWNNIINKNVDRPWQQEKEYDVDDFINNVDPDLTEEEQQAQQAFDSVSPSDKEPRKLSKPLYVNTIEENELYNELEEKRNKKGIDFMTVNPKTGAYEFPDTKDINDFYEIEGNRVGRRGAELFMEKWNAESEKEANSIAEYAKTVLTDNPSKIYVSEFKNQPANKSLHEQYKDYKFWPINGADSNLDFSLQTISNKEAYADYKDLHENGYKDAYSTQIRTPYDVQSEIDNIKKVLDANPNMPYEEKRKLLNQWGSLNDSLLFIYEQNINDYATYLRNKGHEKEAADMLSTYDYYKRKTAGFQTMPVKELDDAEKRIIMNIRSLAINTNLRYLQEKFQTLANNVDIITYQKLAQKPMEVVASQFEILKSIGALDEDGNINPSAKIKQSNQVKLSDAILKINLAKDQIASAAESTGATPENLNELKRLGEKLGNAQSTEFSFYQKYAMEDLKQEDENEKRNQKIAEQRMRSEDFFTSFAYTALYGGSSLLIATGSTLAKIGKVPDTIADAMGDETFIFDGLSAYVDELIKDMNGYQPQDMEGLSGMQEFWMNTMSGVGSLGAMAITGITGGPVLTALTMVSDMTDMGKANGLDDDQAAQWGLLSAFILGRITQLVPESKNFYDALKPSIKRILIDYAKKRITQQEAMAMFSRAIFPSLQKHFAQIGGEMAEEMLEEFTTELMAMGANKIWDNASFNNEFDPNAIIAAGESAASLTAFLAPFKGGRNWSSVEQDALLNLVQNKETVLRNISFNNQAELDLVTKQLTEIENLEKGLVTMPGYMDLTNGDKAKILTDLYIAQAMELAAKNRGLGKNDPGFIEAERIKQAVLDSLKAPKKGEIPTEPELQKPETNAIQEPSTTEVLPGQPGETRETGRKRQGVEPVIEGESTTKKVGKEEVETNDTAILIKIAANFKEDYNSGKLTKGDFGGSRNLGVYEYDNQIVKVVKKKRGVSPDQVELMNERLGDMDNVYFTKKSIDLGDGNMALIMDKASGKDASQLTSEEINNIPQEHWDKFEQDVRELSKRGVQVDLTKRDNLFYDKNKGFGFIDINGVSKDGSSSDKFFEKDGVEYYYPFEQFKIFPKKFEGGKTMFENISTSNTEAGKETTTPQETKPEEVKPEKVNSTEESQAYVDKLTEVKNNDPETYWSVSIPEVEDVEKGTIITNEDGQAIVGADGDIKAVYKNPDSEARRVSDTLLKEAIKAGGIKLDNFDIYLTKIYEENGFRIVSRLPFNEEYAPDGWNKAKHGTPDVVAMVYDPENKLKIEEKQFTNEQYDEAMAYRDTYIDAQKQAYPKTTETDTEAKAQEQRKTIAENLRKWKGGGNGNMYSAGLGIPLAIWNGAIETIATAIEAGVSLADAIQKAKDYLKRNYGKDYDEAKFAEEVMNISLDKVMEDKAKFLETTKEVSEEVESEVVEGKSVDTWIKFSNKIVDNITKRKEKVEVFRGEVNQENIKENAQESYNSTALKLAQYNVFASEDFKNIVNDFGKLPAKKQKQLISDYAKLIDKKIASIQKSIGKLDKKDEDYKADKEEYDNDIKALKEAKKNKSFEDMLTSLDQFSPNTKASIISDIFLNKEIVYNNKGEAVDYKKLNKDQQTQKAEAIYQKAKETVISNLTAVYNSVDPAIRNLSKLWYDGANLISQEFGKQYDLTLEQSAAIIATQSPQMPWFQNLHLAHAIMDIMKNQADTPFSQEMLDLYIKNTKGYAEQKAYIPEVKKLVGKKLSELSEYDASIFVRSYYELNMDKRSPIRIPSGTIVGYEDKVASFSGYDTIAKGVSIFRDGSEENVSKRLGDANKVRNFYLNIANPNDDRAVTIDTHAMAIALMKPLGSSSYEVNFTPPYFAFYADAYREAAEKLGIKTRELQSITWEAARAIFPADEKTDSKKSEVSAIWDKYNNGEITLEEAQNQILKDGKDPNITEWAEFTGKLLDSEQRAEIFLPIRPSQRAETTTEVGDGAGTGGNVPGVGGGDNGKRTSTKLAKGLRKGAEVARKGKTGGLAVNPIDPFLEVIAKALEAGASLTEAIAKGIEAFKNSDFYKNLTSQDKSKAINDLKKAMDEQIAPVIANLINEEMLKGKGFYTASQNVKKEMIKEGVIDEATFDRIVGKSEKLVKADAEMMFNVAKEDAKEAIKAGKSVDEATAILKDAIDKQIGFYSNLDKTIKKDMVDKAKSEMLNEVAAEIAGSAKSYVDTQGILKSEAITQAMDEAKGFGIDPKVVDGLKENIESEYDKIKARDRSDSNKKEPVVTTTEKEIMKDKLKAMDSALKDAVAKAKQEKKDEKAARQSTRNWVKDYLKTSGISSKISPTQLKAIVSRATGLVSDMTDSKMKAFTDYVEKVVADQEYAQMINDLEKNKKGASKKRHNQYTEAVRRYLSLPLVNSDGTPLMNDQELKAYAESVARLNQSIPDHTALDMTLADRVLNDYNQVKQDVTILDFNQAFVDVKTSDINDIDEYRDFVSKVNKAKRILDSLYNQGKITEDEYNSNLEDLYTKENGLRVYEQYHQDQIDALKEGIIDDIVDMSKYVDKSGFIGQQDEVYRRLEIMLGKPEMLMSLDVKDLVKLTEVMDRMADGFVAEKELREIVNKAETRGQKKGESIVNQLASIYKSLNTPDLTKLRNLLRVTEPAQIERVLGLATGPIYNNIIQPINSALTKMRKNSERLMDQYYQARKDSKFKGDVVVKRSEYDTGLASKISDNITVKADKYYSTRVAMLSSIFDYASKAMDQKADTKDFWGENLQKDDVKKAYHNDGSLHIVNDIYSKLNNDPRFQTNGKLDYTKIYEAFLNDPKSVMSDAEYKLYEATQTINNEEIGQALVSANAIRGVNGEISTVHYPRKSLGKSSTEDADLVAGTGGKVGGLRAGSSYSRTLETPTDAIDLNLDRVMATQIVEASRDLYLNDAIQQTNEVFRNAKENANPDEKAILQAIQDWNRKRVDFELEKSAKNIITRAFAGFAPYALIGKVRTPAEFTTNLLAGIFNQISNVAKIGPRALVSPVNPLQAQEAKKIMEKFDSPVQFINWSMKTYAKYGDGKVDKNYLSSFYNNAVNMLMNISGPLTVGEWKSDFDAKFKELTGENYNESKHLDNDEYFYDMQQASSYANQQVERIKGGAFKGQGKQFVATNPITDIKKLFPGVKIKDEEGMVSANDTFAQMTNMFNNFVGRDVKNFVSGAKQAATLKDVTGGFKDMLGSTFRLGSYYVIYNLIDAAMKSALGDDEEKKVGDKKLEMFTTSEGQWQTAFNTVLNLATTVATSKYGANGKAIAVASLNYLYNSATNQEQKDMAESALKSMYFQDPINTEKYGAAEQIIYNAATMYIPPADVIADQLQREFERLAGSDKYKGATLTDFFDQTGKYFNDPEVFEFKKFMAGALTLATQIAVISGKPIPFLKDIVKLVKKDVEDKQNIIILNKRGENMVEGVLDFDIDGNGQLSVTVDIPGMTADQKKVINESLSNAASDKFTKLIEKNKERIDKMPEGDIEQEAEKFAQIQYYADLAKHQAKVEAKLSKPEDAPKEPNISSDYFERKEAVEKMVEKYQEARAKGKFSSSSKLSTARDVQEGVQQLIDNSEYKEVYNSLDPNNVENIGAIQAMNTYFNDLYEYNVTPVPGKEPKAKDYFYKDYKGKITPVK